MGADLISPPPTIIPPLPYRKLNATLLPSTPTMPSSTIFTPPPGPGYNPYPYPMANGFYPYLSPAAAPGHPAMEDIMAIRASS
jgi:hypothetical protein